MKSFFANLFICLLLIIAGALVFGLTLRSVWGNPTLSDIKNAKNEETKPYGVSPEANRFILTQNLVDKRTFALSAEQAEIASPDVGFRNGDYFVFFAPGMSVFAVPFYELGYQYNLSWVSTSAMVGLFSIANLIFIYLIARQVLKLPYWASILASLIFGFGSSALSYATSLYQHQSTVFFILSSFYLVYQYKIHKVWGSLLGFLIWLNFGLAILIDYPNALLMFPVMVYFLLSSINFRKEDDRYKIDFRFAIILTSIFFIIITYLHGYYNQTYFGGWTNLSGASTIPIRTLQKQNATPSSQVKPGQIVATASGTTKSTGSQNTTNPGQQWSAVGLFKEVNLGKGTYELLIASDKGIFFFSPIFILGVLGIFLAAKLKKLNAEIGTLIAIVAVNVFFYSSWADPWGGWAFGPRYLIPSMAVLSIFVSFWLSEFPRFRILNRLLALILFGFSAAVSLVGAITTNAVPPKIEADFIGLKYGYFFNFDMLTRGESGSFAYNYFFHQNFDFVTYYIFILFGIIFMAYIVLFIWPIFEKRRFAK